MVRPASGNSMLALTAVSSGWPWPGIDVLETPDHAADLGLRDLRIGRILLVEDARAGRRRPPAAEPAAARPAPRRRLPPTRSLILPAVGRGGLRRLGAPAAWAARSSGLSRSTKAKAAMTPITSASTAPSTMVASARCAACRGETAVDARPRRRGLLDRRSAGSAAPSASGSTAIRGRRLGCGVRRSRRERASPRPQDGVGRRGEPAGGRRVIGLDPR